MNALRYATGLAAALTVWLASAAPAQQPPATSDCSIDVNKPKPVQSAYLALELKSNPEAQKKLVQDAMRTLTDPKLKNENPVGRHYVMGRTLIWWTDQPGVTPVMRRGDLGYADSPDATIDLYAAIDSSLTAVEKAMPSCASETAPFRRFIWAKAINSAVPLLNGSQLDSARMLLERANAISPDQPHGHFYLSYVAQKKKDDAAAETALKRAIELSTPALMAADSSVKVVRRDAMLNLGAMQQQRMAAAKGEAKKTDAAMAAATFRQYLAEFPDSEDAAKVRGALNGALAESGDTKALAELHAEMTKEPARYTDQQLIEAGAHEFRAGNRERAAQLFEAALVVNPYHRDALLNLTNMYSTLKHYDKMIPVAHRLVAVDPNYPDTWHSIAFAFQEMAKDSKDAKVKKAYQDSSLVYATKERKLPAKVSFSLFDHEGTKHTVKGMVENLTKTPKKYTLKLEFLDKDGKVVATKEEAISLTPGGRTPFTVEVEQAGITAFRYGPLG